ncbi:hypothetical protein Plec18167_005556 [Paecilomyces lecythidis]|uniref:Xylose isomerase-like TIM barrel domain-containing protein n=1 Tax=Paecilomyces lecythidis TaxID=3004212 RepID=A0ABR3XI49_9EURO
MESKIPLSPVKNIPMSYASCSIGCKSSHTLPQKLEAISDAGFTGIELSFPDILDYGSRMYGHQIACDNFAELTTVAGEIRKLCKANNLQVMMLQPFSNFEGWKRGSKDQENAWFRANGWMEIMRVVGTDLLQVGSSDSPPEKLSGRREDIIQDLRDLADKLAQNKFRIAYENWCWSTHAPTWKDVWEIVKEVDRPNVGLCLDTFQTAGSEWGDPTTSSGLIESIPRDELEKRWKASMDELARSIPPEKIYLLQISDAYKPVTPIENKEINGLRPRGRWSHDFRPLPYDGGYLPIEDVTRAVLKTGFRGWFSMEVFDGGPEGKGKDYEMSDYAAKAQDSMQRLIQSSAPR